MKKLTHQRQSRFFEKVVSKNGKLFSIRFVIVEREGKLLGKIISCAEIRGEAQLTSPSLRLFYFTKGNARVGEGERFYLPAWKHFNKVKDKGLKIKDFYISPYFDCFEFLTCIQIRAPSLNNS